MRIQFRQIVVEQLIVSVVVRLHVTLIQSECGQMKRLIQQIGETHERLVRFHVEDQDGRDVRHALDVAHVRSVANVSGQQRMQHVGVRPTLLEDAQVGKRPRYVELDHVHAALLVVLGERVMRGRFRTVETVLGAGQANVVQLAADIQFVSNSQAPDAAAHAGWKTLPP